MIPAQPIFNAEIARQTAVGIIENAKQVRTRKAVNLIMDAALDGDFKTNITLLCTSLDQAALAAAGYKLAEKEKKICNRLYDSLETCYTEKSCDISWGKQQEKWFSPWSE